MDFIDMFPPNRNAIDLQDLVSFPQKAATLCCSAFHHPADHHAVHVVTHCGTLRITRFTTGVSKTTLKSNISRNGDV